MSHAPQDFRVEIGSIAKRLWIQGGWYINLTNHRGGRYFHTNQKIGPVSIYGRYDHTNWQDEGGEEREIEISYHFFLGPLGRLFRRRSQGLSLRFSWRFGDYVLNKDD